MKNKSKQSILLKALKQIAKMPAECSEWQGAEYYAKCQEIARVALNEAGFERGKLVDENAN